LQPQATSDGRPSLVTAPLEPQLPEIDDAPAPVNRFAFGDPGPSGFRF
jgi:hypothetical protein